MNILLLSLPGIEENDGNLVPASIGSLAGTLNKHHRGQAYYFAGMEKRSVECLRRRNQISVAPSIVVLSGRRLRLHDSGNTIDGNWPESVT